MQLFKMREDKKDHSFCNEKVHVVYILCIIYNLQFFCIRNEDQVLQTEKMKKQFCSTVTRILLKYVSMTI